MIAYTTAQFGQPVMPPAYERTGIIADIFGLDAPSVHLEEALANAWAALAKREKHRKGFPSSVRVKDESKPRDWPKVIFSADAILACIKANPGMRACEIAKVVGCSEVSARKAAARLAQAGRIVRTRDYKFTRWSVAQ